MLEKLLNADTEKVYAVCSTAAVTCLIVGVVTTNIVDRVMPYRPFDALQYCMEHTGSQNLASCAAFAKHHE